MNSLGINEGTKLFNASGDEITIDDFQQGDSVKVTLKDACTEEKPYYYPTVHEIELSAD